MPTSHTMPLAEPGPSLIEALGENMVLTDPHDMARYCRDWHGDVVSSAIAVLRPGSTAEVAAAVRQCRALGLHIVPQGGNTGLVLGAIPDAPAQQVVLSLERLNRIRSIDADDFSVVVEAGCVLASVKEAVAAQDLLLPLALGAQGSCQIGGNISTNAGGVNVLRYGMMREQVLGLEVVLADGTVWNGLSNLRKDNRGIDLKHLFIGAEGTLGIITAAALKLVPRPQQVETALLGLHSLDDVLRLYRRARRDCCDLITAFEFMPPAAFPLAQKAMPDLVMPLPSEYTAYVLLEISGSGLVDVAALLSDFLHRVMEDGLVADGVLATSRVQAQKLWAFRDGMNDGQALHGPHLRTDVSVPLSQIPAFVAAAEQALRQALPDCQPVSYGHVGDGNVHMNVLPPAGLPAEACQQRLNQAKTLINHMVDQFKGSISAEHGIGRLKRPDFEARLTHSHRQLLQTIKQALDPQGLLNPGCQLNHQANSLDKTSAHNSP